MTNEDEMSDEVTVETQSALFALEPDNRLEDLRDWIKYQWAFKCWYVFWPTEAQIVQIAEWFKVLCETVIEECDAEFIRHCDTTAETVSS